MQETNKIRSIGEAAYEFNQTNPGVPSIQLKIDLIASQVTV